MRAWALLTPISSGKCSQKDFSKERNYRPRFEETLALWCLSCPSFFSPPRIPAGMVGLCLLVSRGTMRYFGLPLITVIHSKGSAAGEKCRKPTCNQKNDYVKMASSVFLPLFPWEFPHPHFLILENQPALDSRLCLIYLTSILPELCQALTGEYIIL